MAKEKICGIYCIENLVNGKKYIGQSIDVERRLKQHKNSINSDRKSYFLYQAFAKYNFENFKFTILEKCNSDELNTKEKYWINYYDTFANGYNMTAGGRGVNELSVNRNKLPKNFNTFANNSYGITDVIKIVELDVDMNILHIWESVQDCSRNTGLIATNISKCANLKHLKCENRIFMYYDDVVDKSKNEIVEFRKNKRSSLLYSTDKYSYLAKLIYEIDNDGNILNTYKSANSAANILGLDCSSIIKVCKGRLKQTKGHKFIYAN